MSSSTSAVGDFAESCAHITCGKQLDRGVITGPFFPVVKDRCDHGLERSEFTDVDQLVTQDRIAHSNMTNDFDHGGDEVQVHGRSSDARGR